MLSLDDRLLLTKQLREVIAALRQPDLATADWQQFQQQRLALEQKLCGTTHISARVVVTI